MSNPRIYVVDDSVSVLIAVERMLHARGFDVTIERSGVAALDYLRGHHPDLVICDLVLPDVDGTEICALASGRRDGPPLPVIAISGLVDDQIRASARRAGALRVLEKPFDANALLAAIEDAFRTAAKPRAEAPRDPVAMAPPAELPDVLATLDGLTGWPGFRFGILLRLDGETVHRFGSAPSQVGSGARALIEIARRSAALAAWLGETDPHQLLFEASEGFVIAGRLGPDHLIVLVVESTSALGKARLILRRLRSRGAHGQAPDRERSLLTFKEANR